IKTLEEKQTSATDYIIDFSKQVYQMITLLKNSTFVKDGTEVVIRQRNGPMIQEILPVNYQLEENSNDFLPPPLDDSCMMSKVEEGEFSRLFTKSHLQLIHSTYFGSQGIKEGSMKGHPFHASFLKIMPRNLNDVTITDPYGIKMALSTYMTNFENMWSDGKRATKVLNRLIDVLLKIHLAPQRETKYKLYLAKKKKGRSRTKEGNEYKKTPNNALESYQYHQ
ncbi:hypothetical protein BDF21DRAFT_332533, partial [Thamnidium elegans]